jgi:hypothetical protein
MELRTKLSQRDDLAAIGSQVLPHINEVQELINAKGKKTSKGSEDAKDLPWNPPHEFNPAWASELAKPQEQQDPNVIRQYNELTSYVQDRWSQWMMNPSSFVQEMVAPAIQDALDQYQERAKYAEEIRSALDGNEEVALKYEADIRSAVSEGVPLSYAIRMALIAAERDAAKSGQASASGGSGDTETTIPGKRKAPKAVGGKGKGIALDGAVTQKGSAESDDDDSTEYLDARAAMAAAFKAAGVD